MTYRVRSTDIWHSMPGVVAAYQPIGAPSDVEARFNIGAWQQMVGNYTATPGTAPTWNAQAGWGFNGTTNSRYLKTGILPSLSWSMLVRFVFSGAVATALYVCGAYAGATKRFNLVPNYNNAQVLYGQGDYILVAPPILTTGVIGISGNRGYRNGIVDGGAIGAGTDPGCEIYIGSLNNAGTPLTYYNGNVLSFVICSRILTASEVWQASMQMAYCEANPAWNAWAPRRRYWQIPIEAPAPIAAPAVIGLYRPRSTDVWHSMPGVVAAYQPIGAPSDVEARFNIGAWQQMVGNYTATPGTAPTWNAQAGWGFNGSSQYLKSGVRAQYTWSMLIRYSGVTNTGIICGSDGAANERFWLRPSDGTNVQYACKTNVAAVAPVLLAGVIGIASYNCYRNGLADGTITAGGATDAIQNNIIFIGCRSLGANPSLYCACNILSLLIVSRTLTPAEAWRASQQMAYCDSNPAWNVWAPRKRYFIPASPAVAGAVGIYGTRATIALPGGVSIRATGGQS